MRRTDRKQRLKSVIAVTLAAGMALSAAGTPAFAAAAGEKPGSSAIYDAGSVSERIFCQLYQSQRPVYA